MKRYIDQIIIIPVMVLYFLVGVLIFNRLGIKIDYVVYSVLILLGLLTKYIKNNYSNRITQIACTIVPALVIIVVFFDSTITLSKGIYLGIAQSDISLINVVIKEVFNDDLFARTYCVLSFITIMCSYNRLIVKKRIKPFIIIILLICYVMGLLPRRIDALVICMIVLTILLSVFNDAYYNINLLDFKKSLIIILLFVCCSIASYFFVPYIDSINIRSEIISLDTNLSSFIENVFNNNSVSLSSTLKDVKLNPEQEVLSDKVIMRIDTSYQVDRIKAYSCGKFDTNINSFIIDKKITLDNDFTELYIKQGGADLSEYYHVTAVDNVDKIVYVPYGLLSIPQKVINYEDQVIQFKDKDNYNDYSLTFEPSFSKDSLNSSDLSVYREYVKQNYSNNNSESMPQEIKESIEKFISEDELNYYPIIDDINAIDFFSTEYKIQTINRINNYINSKFKITDKYERNNSVNDISYALENKHEANPQLLAAIATYMYRYENIPSRYVVGYKAIDYKDNVLYIHENNKQFWSEVFINDCWYPSDNIELVEDGDSEIVSKIQEMDGSIDDSFDKFSNLNEEVPDDVVLKIETNNKIDKIKQTSYGDYNLEKHSFEYEESITDYDSIKKASRAYGLKSFFNKLFIKDDKLQYYIKVTSYIDTDTAYVPYGEISIQDANMYQDKAVILNENKQSYLINYEPYSKNNVLSSNTYYEDYVYEKYLQVPEEMVSQLQEFLLSKGIDYKAKSKSLLISQIKNLLQSEEYTYTLKPGNVPQEKDTLLYFLLENKKGYCQHYAGSATLLYRICGIPSRYVVGFAVDDYQNGVANLTAKDAHAWTEVFTTNKGWVPIEVTGSRRSNFELIDGDFILKENNNQLSNNEIHSVNSESIKNQYNTQPNSMVDKQEVIQNKTYINDIVYEENDEVLFTIETDKEINRVKKYSLGNYNIDNQKFFLGEDISNHKAIIKINELYDIDSFFISLFTTNNELDNKMTIKYINDNKWLCVPYGKLNINEAFMYQDKYFYFDNENKYDEYTISYSTEVTNSDSNMLLDYENFVYQYYTQIPHDFEYLLRDFLAEKQIDPDSSDKLTIINKLQDLFITKYIYKDVVKENNDGTDSTLDFVIRRREGNDDLFAKGATLLFRLCDIPTRIVSGYVLDEYKNGKYEVKEKNNHLWVEVYTSNYGWMPVEVCPKFTSDSISDYQFEKHISIEDDIEFVDIEEKHKETNVLMIIGFISTSCVIVIGISLVKKYRDEYKEKLRKLGIETKEQLKLLKEINKKYQILVNNNYYNKEVEDIMLRIRFSPRKETNEDLLVIQKHIEYMKEERKRKKNKY